MTGTQDDSRPDPPEYPPETIQDGDDEFNCRTAIRQVLHTLVAVAALSVLLVEPALAATQATKFCDSKLVATTKNVFTVVQLGGPLLGGVVAIGATALLPTTRRSDLKRELKTARNQGLVWGVIVAPLGTEIVRFILNNIVVGGTTCGF